MTRKDFSNGFDTLVNSYRRFRSFDNKEATDSIEFDEYEKSFFLTKAQEEIVVELYTGKNGWNDSFESSEEMRRYLSSLIGEKTENPITNSQNTTIGMGSKSSFFTLPEDLWFITYEAVSINNNGECNDGATLEVTPVTQDEYHRIRKNPFRGANKRRALRLDLADGVVEIVCNYTVSSYYVRYLKKLSPIVLEDLPNNLTVNGENSKHDCLLHEALHQRILERAVVLGLHSKGYNFERTKDNN